MKINHHAQVFLLLALTLGLTSSSLWAAEDGLGTNVVRNLRVNDGGTLTLGGEPITNWYSMPTGTNAVSLADYLATNAVFAGATNVLNTSVTNVSYQVTNLLYGATNALNTAVTNLNARTNDWNNGVIIYKGDGAGLTAGNLYYLNGSAAWTPANASTNTTAKGLIGLALGATAAEGLLLNGQYTNNNPSFDLGATLYMGTNDCVITNIAPFRTNHVVRIVGYVINAETIMFNPDRTYIEILGE